MSAYNGSGTFVISGTGLPFVTATTISSTVVNQLDTDLATGLSTAICKDGQTTVTANIPLAGFKLTGVGAATTANDALTYGTGTNSSTLLVPTRQILTSGSGATYTTPTGVRQIRIRMLGAGGGGGSNVTNASDGTTGGTAFFNGISTIGGIGGHSSGNPGAGGTGGSNTPTGGAVTGLLRRDGAYGITGVNGISTSSANGGNGASSVFGAGPGGGSSASNNSGAGGGGGGISSANGYSGGGGGAGEYVEFIINSPSATYLYTVPAGGTAGTFGGNGGSGCIIVDEFY